MSTCMQIFSTANVPKIKHSSKPNASGCNKHQEDAGENCGHHLPECGCADRHDGGYQCVDLSKWRVLNMQPVCRYPVECCIVQHNNTVCTLCQSLQGQQRVIWLHHHITDFILVREHTVSLYQLLWEAVCKFLQDVGPHTWTSPSSNWVTQHKTLQNTTRPLIWDLRSSQLWRFKTLRSSELWCCKVLW